MLVTGVVPGPALWKVSKGDHVLCVLGTVTPLPRAIQWDTGRMERLVANSQEVMELPDITIGSGIGFWKGITLLPLLVGVKKLPDGKTLKDVLPASVYDRWITQKDKYLTDIKGWHDDRLRPYFAAHELYGAALKAHGLTSDTRIESQVVALAKKSKVPIVDPMYQAHAEHPRAGVKQFKQATFDENGCFADTLDAVEHGLAQTSTRANAWATGNLQALMTVYRVPQQDACLSALFKSPIAADAGLNDGTAKVWQHWVTLATAALQRNHSTVALLPMAELFKRDGVLAKLAAAGYRVTAPGP